MHEELVSISAIFTRNGFPRHVIQRCIKEVLDNAMGVDPKTTAQEAVPHIYTLPLQFRGVHTTAFAGRLRSILSGRVRIVYLTTKLRSLLPLPRYQPQVVECSKVVYTYLCPHCRASYIGQTKRHLVTRIAEHSKAALGDHHLRCSASMDAFSQCFSICERARHESHLLPLEALLIKQSKPVLNTQLNGGDALPLHLRLL